MRLDVRKDIQSVKYARSTLHAELQICIRPPFYGNIKGRKTNTLTHKSMCSSQPISYHRFSFHWHLIAATEISDIRKLGGLVEKINNF